MLYKAVVCFVLVFSYPICLLMNNHAVTVQAYKAKGEYCIHLKPSFFLETEIFSLFYILYTNLAREFALSISVQCAYISNFFMKMGLRKYFRSKAKGFCGCEKNENVIIWDSCSSARAILVTLFPPPDEKEVWEWGCMKHKRVRWKHL